MMFIKDTHLQILFALLRYKFLSISQIQDLRIGLNNYRWIGEVLREMRKKGWVGSTDAPMARKKLPNSRRLGSLYFIEKKGLAVIEEVYDLKTQYKCSKTTSTHDYFHRKETVSFQINVDHFVTQLPLEIGCWERYFDKIGGNRGSLPMESITKIGIGEMYIIPDIVFSLHDSGNVDERLLFCVEISMCDQFGFSKPLRIVDKVKRYLQAIEEKSISNKYSSRIPGLSSEVTPRILFTFETTQFMYEACEKIGKIQGFWDYSELFYFASKSALNSNFGSGWRRLDSEATVNFITGNSGNKKSSLPKEVISMSERVLLGYNHLSNQCYDT